MNQKIKKIVVLSIVLIISIVFTRCQKDDDLSNPQSNQISLAKNWFKEYESSSNNYALLQNLNYEWNEANITKSEDGTETIIVPVIESKKDEGEFWEQRLYIYKTSKEDYKALVYEINTNKNVPLSSQSIDGGDFTGFISVWDLKTGFVKAAKFKNNQVVENGVVEVNFNNRGTTNRAPIEAPCAYSGADGGCDKGGGGEVPQAPNLPGTVLREVPVSAPGKASPVEYYGPRSPVIGGSTTGGYTSPTGGGSSSGGGGTSTDVVPPSCESFNFKKDGSLWQVAMVKNINFRVIGLSPSGVQVTHSVSYPQAIYFGTPTNVQVGNTSITAGIAATTSAKVLQKSMQEVIDKYGGTDVSDLILDQYFRERLTYNYPLYVPGGRVNFNSTSSIPATNYKTNFLTSGDCN